ncbi:MAG TPA: tRNA pseudouridine(55) synthase TruB [Clostridiales bacterium]|nr:tRNA pseudouridine(55) synthase TruB [Clostridiales bacterium]
MDGIIIVNKEKNWTSNDVVQKIKGIFHEKVGHTGTLDPLATGVIPILVGKGTLLSKYLINHDKEYIATIKLGEKTSTGDSEGEILEQKNVDDTILDEAFVKSTLKKFEGKITQIPPIYSAIKVNGKKLYEYARKGQSIEIPSRNIEIYNIELVSISKLEKEIIFKVHCSKGTYIRTLCEDIAKELGTVGFMKELQRIKVGGFSIENSLTISELENKEKVDNNFITIENFFLNKEKVELDSANLKKFINGVKIKVQKNDNVYKIYYQNRFIGIGIVSNCILKRDIIL